MMRSFHHHCLWDYTAPFSYQWDYDTTGLFEDFIWYRHFIPHRDQSVYGLSQREKVTSLVGWAHTQNDACSWLSNRNRFNASHDSTVVESCTKFCINADYRIWVRANGYLHPTRYPMETSFVELAQDNVAVLLKLVNSPALKEWRNCSSLCCSPVLFVSVTGFRVLPS